MDWRLRYWKRIVAFTSGFLLEFLVVTGETEKKMSDCDFQFHLASPAAGPSPIQAFESVLFFGTGLHSPCAVSMCQHSAVLPTIRYRAARIMSTHIDDARR